MIVERPILFRSEMVNAILDDGRKSQTRRIVDKRGFVPYKGCSFDRDFPTVGKIVKSTDEIWRGQLKAYPGVCIGDWRCPYGKAGDRLWVRETWKVTGRYRGEVKQIYEQCLEYRADHSHVSKFESVEQWNLAKEWLENRQKKNKHGWGTPIHMPRWASRILLEITSIGCERVQDISIQDCFAEGITDHDGSLGWAPQSAKTAYAKLWGSINGVGSWASNPWVWKICFKRIT